MKLQTSASQQTFNSEREKEDSFLPLLYVPASLYKKNATQITKKSRADPKKNMTEKVSRNPAGLLNTLSNKSVKGNQISLEDIEIKAKKLFLSNHEKDGNKKEEKSIAIFAGFRTTKGFHPKKPDKTNQDRMLITSKFNNASNQWVFCIFDGHGTDGHKVSQFIRDNLCTYLLKQKTELMILGRKRKKPVKDEEKQNNADDDSLIYYSSVGENTEVNNSIENDIDYQKLEDETTIFKQIQNYTKNVLIKKTFENLNNSLK